MLSLSSPQSSSFRCRPVSCWCWIIFVNASVFFWCFMVLISNKLILFSQGWRAVTLTTESHWFSFTFLLFWSSISCLRSWTASPPCTHTQNHTPPAAFNPDRLTNLWVYECVCVTSSSRPSVATAVCWPLTEYGSLLFDLYGVDRVVILTITLILYVLAH